MKIGAGGMQYPAFPPYFDCWLWHTYHITQCSCLLCTFHCSIRHWMSYFVLMCR